MMKHGIFQAICDGDLRDALRKLERCKETRSVDLIHQYVSTALIDGAAEVQHALALKAKAQMQLMADFEFQADERFVEVA